MNKRILSHNKGSNHFILDAVSSVYQGVSPLVDHENSLMLTKTLNGEIRGGPLLKRSFQNVKREAMKRQEIMRMVWDYSELEFGNSKDIERIVKQAAIEYKNRINRT